MTSPAIPAALMLLLAAPAVPAGSPVIAWGQVAIHQRIVIRVPRMPIPPGRQPIGNVRPMQWVEKNAPKCVPVDTLAAATISEADSVDLVVRGGGRLRAKLGDDCPALDFYSGFYLKRTDDGMLCAKRDSIRSRSGDNCPIVAFKHLVPAR